MISTRNTSTSAIILNGKIASIWKKILKKNTVEIRLNPFIELNKDEQKVLESEIAVYGEFIGTLTFLVK